MSWPVPAGSLGFWGRASLRAVGRGIASWPGPLCGSGPCPVDSQRAKLESREQGVKMEKVVSLQQGLKTRGLWAESSLSSILKFGKLYVKIRLTGFLLKIPPNLATPDANFHMAIIS